MQKKRNFILALMAILTLGWMTSCQPEQKTPETPVITFNQDVVNVPKEGGAFSVEFAIANPIEGELASVVAPSAEWISDVDTSIEGIVQFKVAVNKTVEPREATFTVNYKNAQEASFVVKQAEGDPVPFKFENADVQMTSFRVDVIPHNKELSYILFITSQSYIDQHELYTDEALFADDLEYFMLVADESGMSVSEFLDEIACQGDLLGWESKGMTPGSSYVVYAYHIDTETQERLSDIVRYEFTTKVPSETQVDFDLSFNVNGPLVDMTIDPKDFDGYYFFDALDLQSYYEAYGQGADFETYMSTYWNEFFAAYGGNDYAFEFLASSMLGQGKQTYHFDDLQPETEYAFYVVALDDASHYIASKPVYEVVTTESIQASDLQVTIEIKELDSRKVVVDYKASNNDPYTVAVVSREKLESYGDTNEERMNGILNDYDVNIQTVTGDLLAYEVSPLNAETDYYAVAFGTMGSAVTTDLFSAAFTTESAKPSGVVMTAWVDTYYDLGEVGALNDEFAGLSYVYGSNIALVPVQTATEPQASTYYYNFYYEDREGDFAHYSDEDWIGVLTKDSQRYTPTTVFLLTYDQPYFFVGVGVDAEGNFGPVAIIPMSFGTEEVGDPSEFLEWYFNTYASPSCVAPMQLGR